MSISNHMQLIFIPTPFLFLFILLSIFSGFNRNLQDSSLPFEILNDSRNSECGLSGGGWRTWNENGRKREGSHLTSYKSSGYQRDHNQTGHS
ncbi:hypothetical protein LWI29_000585 [Acer saccharum]|uniref:Transmembrane protein n=1 Tax=Acer saccharum TaxID=4024 RepID=A0AA39RG57_ACESA|nr:hypothetical protein LWI29_000585 [Acer saccharum]